MTTEKKCSWCSGEKKTAEDWSTLLTELYAHGRMLAFERSFFNADRAEKKRRMRWVVELAAELAKIRESTTWATGSAEADIEHVIEGDWKLLAESVKHWKMDEELTKDAKKVYTRFIALLEHCLTELVEAAGAEA